MSFTAKFRYTLDDLKVCAKIIRRRKGTTFYKEMVLAAFLTFFVLAVIRAAIIGIQGDIYVGAVIWIDRIIIVILEACILSQYTDKAKAESLMKKFAHREQRILIDDDGIRLPGDIGETVYWYWGIEELYFREDVWMLIVGNEKSGESAYFIAIPCRGITEGDPKELGAYLSRMCGKEVKYI